MENFVQAFKSLIKKIDAVINIIALILWVPGIIFILLPSPKVIFGISLIFAGSVVIGFWSAVRFFEKRIPKMLKQ